MRSIQIKSLNIRRWPHKSYCTRTWKNMLGLFVCCRCFPDSCNFAQDFLLKTHCPTFKPTLRGNQTRLLHTHACTTHAGWQSLEHNSCIYIYIYIYIYVCRYSGVILSVLMFRFWLWSRLPWYNILSVYEWPTHRPPSRTKHIVVFFVFCFLFFCNELLKVPFHQDNGGPYLVPERFKCYIQLGTY